jgi:hypothetical protein
VFCIAAPFVDGATALNARDLALFLEEPGSRLCRVHGQRSGAMTLPNLRRAKCGNLRPRSERYTTILSGAACSEWITLAQTGSRPTSSDAQIVSPKSQTDIFVMIFFVMILLHSILILSFATQLVAQ